MHNALRRIELCNSAAIDDEHLVRKRQRFFRIMRHNQRREFELSSNGADALFNGFFNQSVKRRKRLVKEQKARLHHQRSRQRHALLLTAGKLLHAAFKMRLES